MDWQLYLRFGLSGLIGTLLFKILFDVLMAACTFKQGCSAASWFVSYLLSIIWQHFLHERLVFGVSANYWESLFWTYVSYSASFVVSTALNWVLVENLHFSAGLAWFITLASTGERNSVCRLTL
jgi:hypothetical protein